MEPKQKGLVAALSANVIWGFTSIPIRELRNYSPEQILFFRIFISLFFCWLFILLFKKPVVAQNIALINKGGKKTYFLLILSGLLITLNWYAFIYVVNNINLNSAAFAYMVCPIITAIAGFVVLKEKVNKLKIASICIAIISIIILATGSLNDVLWSVMIASFYTVYIIVQKTLHYLDNIFVLGLNLIIAMLLTFPFLYHQLYFTTDFNFWILMLCVSVIFTLIPLILSLYSLDSLNSSTVGILIYINPVVAFSIAFLYFHENINPNQIFAYALLIFAIIIFNWNIVGSFFQTKKKIEG